MRKSSARAIGISTRLKYGAPMESWLPVIASAMSGYSVPRSTVTVAATNRTFWNRNTASRESGAPREPRSASSRERQSIRPHETTRIATR